jgi:hypothetical protein
VKASADLAPEQELVPLIEVAGLLGMHIGGLLEEAEARGALLRDWRGQHAVEASVADEIVAGRREAQAKHRANRLAHRAYLDDRRRRRETAAQKSAIVAFERARRGDQMRENISPDGASGAVLQGSSSHARAAYNDSYEQAGAEFDRREPVLDFHAWCRKEKR